MSPKDANAGHVLVTSTAREGLPLRCSRAAPSAAPAPPWRTPTSVAFSRCRELARFIAAGRLHCKIDKVGEVVETNRPDSKNYQYQVSKDSGKGSCDVPWVGMTLRFNCKNDTMVFPVAWLACRLATKLFGSIQAFSVMLRAPGR